MRNCITFFLAILSLSLLLGGCRTYSDPQMYHNYAPRALASEAGDVYLLRVQGRGMTKDDAVRDASMQAVRSIIFSDIQVTYGDHRSLLRLINNPSVEEKNSEFFSSFFSPSGPYTRFVSPQSKDRKFYSSSDFQTVVMNVKVDRKALKEYLKESGVL